MNYDYKVINTDPTVAFIKRAALYVAILFLTMALALILLFILFERYLMLLMPGGMILFFVIVCVLVGRSPSYFSYHFTDRKVEISTNGKLVATCDLKDLEIEKKAESADFSIKATKKYTFTSNRIVVKTAQNDAPVSVKAYLVKKDDGQSVIMAFDDYALSLLRGAENGL